jgi:hypothetical protein
MKDILQPLVKEFMPFAQERMGFKKPPRIFLRNDPENAQNPLGKTAYYDPQEMSVTLYINGRHPKDIMRSLSHELVHHTQNCNGEFDNMPEMGEGYAQKDPHLREMERKAYEIGNLCLRDWEDTRKGTIYIQNMNVDIQKEGKLNMSTKDWKNRELPTLLTEKWGFSFNLLTESQEEPVEEGVFKLDPSQPNYDQSAEGAPIAKEQECKKLPALIRATEKKIPKFDPYAGYLKWQQDDIDNYRRKMQGKLKNLKAQEESCRKAGYLEEALYDEGMCQQCAPNPCSCGMMQEQEEELEESMQDYYDDLDYKHGFSGQDSRGFMTSTDNNKKNKKKKKDNEKELEEGGAALRVGNEDRHHQRQAHPDRIHEEEEAEEKKSKTKKKHPLDVEPPHTGEPDAKDFAKLRKDKKKDMNEAQIRHLIRKLVKEAMKRKETK